MDLHFHHRLKRLASTLEVLLEVARECAHFQERILHLIAQDFRAVVEARLRGGHGRLDVALHGRLGCSAAAHLLDERSFEALETFLLPASLRGQFLPQLAHRTTEHGGGVSRGVANVCHLRGISVGDFIQLDVEDAIQAAEDALFECCSSATLLLDAEVGVAHRLLQLRDLRLELRERLG